MSDGDSEMPLVPAPVFKTPSGGRGVLIGPLGLRAGWGILIYFLLAALLGWALFAGLFRGTGQMKQYRAESKQAQATAARLKAAHQPVPVRPLQPLPTLLGEVAQAGAALLAALGLSWLERRRFRVYGVGPGRLGDVAVGAVWGFVAIGLLVAVLRGFHLLVFDDQLLHRTAALRYGAFWLGGFFLVGLAEEFLFRGYIQFTLMRGLLGLAQRLAPGQERGVAFALSALVWSGLFFVAHIHNAGETATGLAAVFLAGVTFSYALWRTGSLWWGIGAHTTWDWAQSFLFGVPDSGTISAGRLFQTHAVGPAWLSGGIDGPEGSVLVIPALLLLMLAVRLHRAGPQPTVEPEHGRAIETVADVAGSTATPGLSL